MILGAWRAAPCVQAAAQAARRAASFAWAAVACLGCSGSSASPPPPDAGATGNFALHFNGTTDYATTGTAGFPSGRQPQTISLWVRYSDATGTQTFVALRQSFASGVEVGLRHGTIAVWTALGDNTLVEAPMLPSAGVWHHVAYVFDLPADGYSNTLYIDGAMSATTSATPDKLTPLSSWLGSVDGTRQLYAGDMDEIRIWHLARSSDEVLQDMQGLVGSQEPGLVAYFDCDAIQGTRLLDDSGNGNDATLGGGDPAYMPTLVPSAVPPAM
jgi:Concanavalin A-like lectin/glucanases superfamily